METVERWVVGIRLRRRRSNLRARLRNRVAKLRILIGLAGLLAIISPAYADITYIHDPEGRLVGVVDGAGNVVTFSYDNDSNLTAIQRPSGEVVISLSPDNGSVGNAVTIYGNHFSPTPTVSFNGKPAAVTSSSSTSISTSVPNGATTGSVTVDSVQGPVFTVH